MKSSFALVIPAYNEMECIAEVVKGLLDLGSVVVVDDGSIDMTGEIAKLNGAWVVKHDSNLGYDAAIISGLSFAKKHDFDYAITIDADGQHNPIYIENFKCCLLQGADLVVGKRDSFQRFSEYVFSILSEFKYGVSDPLCGLKGYNLKRLTNDMLSRRYDSIGTSILFSMIRKKYSLVQIEIKTLPRNGKSKFGSGLRSNIKILRAMLSSF
jgi:glycosyltransferase involved in cell wall biosynthesis